MFLEPGRGLHISGVLIAWYFLISDGKTINEEVSVRPYQFLTKVDTDVTDFVSSQVWLNVVSHMPLRLVQEQGPHEERIAMTSSDMCGWSVDPWSCTTNWQVDGSSVLMATAVLHLPCRGDARTDYFGDVEQQPNSATYELLALPERQVQWKHWESHVFAFFSNLPHWNHFDRKT